MIEDARLVRVNVNKTGIQTALGVHIGDNETRVKSL